MRMRNIPRALQSESSLAEPIELGSGIVDRRVQHGTIGPLQNSQVNNLQEREWFDQLENADEDPRNARSDYHDPVNVMLDNREKTIIEEVELATGYIKNAVMYPDGAHLQINNEDEKYFVFIQGTNFVVYGTKVKIIDRVIKTSYASELFKENGEFPMEESHSLMILEDDGDESENDEITA